MPSYHNPQVTFTTPLTGCMAERVAAITQETSTETMVRPASSQGVKRRASPNPEEDDTVRPKRLREDSTSNEEDAVAASLQAIATIPIVDGVAFADDLAQELQCGCCSELVYRPVVVSAFGFLHSFLLTQPKVNPCQHFFCGSCCALWIRVSGTFFPDMSKRPCRRRVMYLYCNLRS